MSQLVTGGWKTINIYAGQNACEYNAPFLWYSLEQFSVRIRLTSGRWYSTWTWIHNYDTGDSTTVPPEDTPGKQG